MTYTFVKCDDHIRSASSCKRSRIYYYFVPLIGVYLQADGRSSVAGVASLQDECLPQNSLASFVFCGSENSPSRGKCVGGPSFCQPDWKLRGLPLGRGI